MLGRKPAWPHPSGRPHPHERLDRPPLVHRRVGLTDIVEIRLEVEDAPWVDAPLEDIVEQLRQVGAYRRGAAQNAPENPLSWRGTRGAGGGGRGVTRLRGLGRACTG